MLFWICEGSDRSGRAVHRSRVKELVRVCSLRLVKEPQFSVLVVNEDTIHAGPAWKDASTALTCAADTVRNYIYFVKEKCSLQEGIHDLPNFKSWISLTSSTSQNDLSVVVNGFCGESSAVEQASTEAHPAPRRSDEPKLGDPAALPQRADGGKPDGLLLLLEKTETVESILTAPLYS